jgi:hypothetical protein
MTDGKWNLPLENIFHIPFDIFHVSIAAVDYEVENPMREDSNGDDERGSLAIAFASRADRWPMRRRTKEAPRPGCAF